MQKMRKRFNFDPFLAAALLIATAAALPLLGSSFINTRGGGDSPFLLQRVQQMTAALQDGHFPVRWMPDANYGNGYPFFNYYAPLSIYFAAFLRLLGLGTVSAIQLTQLLGFWVAGWGMYRLGRDWFQSSHAALIASIAYTLAPFHLVNVYVRGDSLAEFWAMAFYPWVLLAVDHALASTKWRSGLPLAFAYAALVLSHNISALIFTPFLGLYVLLKILFLNPVSFDDGSKSGRDKRGDFDDDGKGGHPLAVAPRRLHQFVRLLAFGVLGLALSAWFWLPALAEQSLVQLNAVTEGYFHYSRHFRRLNLVQPTLFFDYNSDGSAFSMGLIQAILAIFGLLLWKKRLLPRPATLFIFASAALATLMITPLSTPLWQRLPLLPFTQFPWRFLSVQALPIALLSAAIVAKGSKNGVVQRAMTAAILILLTISTLGRLKPDKISLHEVSIQPQSLAQYEWFSGNIGTTISAEYLPADAQPRTFTSQWLNSGARAPGTFIVGDGRANLTQFKTARQTWLVEVDTDSAEIMLPLVYWPGWQLTLDGQPQPVEIAASGLVQVGLEKGTHTVDLQLKRTKTRVSAELLSLTALLLTLPLWNRRLLLTTFAASLILIGTTARAAAIDVDYAAPSGHDMLNWDFDQMAYLHPEPQGVLFSDGSRLMGYEVSAEAPLLAGDTLTYTLHWQTAPTQPAQLALTTPAIYRNPDTTALWAATLGNDQITLQLPETIPPGLYLPQLTLPNDARALTPSGQQRGILYLAPILITPASAQSIITFITPQTRLYPQTHFLPNGSLDLTYGWLLDHPSSTNLSVNVRLIDSLNRIYMDNSAQPSGGFQPTTLWQPQVWQNDRLILNWLADDGIPPYTLVTSLFDSQTDEKIISRRLGIVTQAADGSWQIDDPHLTALPADFTPLDITFGDQITLVGYHIEQTDEQLLLRLAWRASAPITDDFTHFVHLIDPTTGKPIAQHDAQPQFDTYPTTQFQLGEIIIDPAPIPLTDIPAGTYQLAVGLYKTNGDNSRLYIKQNINKDSYSLPINVQTSKINSDD